MIFKDVIFKFGVGGENKMNSSSWILNEWKAPKTERSWGMYRVIYDSGVVGRHTKVKELVIEPGQSLSLQKHKHRNEFWHVVEGACNVQLAMNSGYNMPGRTLGPHDRIDILTNEWHRLSNPYNTPCKIIEIQYGGSCDEEDIERRTT
jgi:mannose-6-phosphate isomerase-like protein (cupin superfamily)